jgi:hypothetical protein
MKTLNANAKGGNFEKDIQFVLSTILWKLRSVFKVKPLVNHQAKHDARVGHRAMDPWPEKLSAWISPACISSATGAETQ